MPTTSAWHLSRTKYSWKPRRPSGVRIVVRTASSLIGRRRAGTPASAYITESRSGETRSPHTSASSPVLTTTVSAEASSAAARPRSSLAAPVPPASAATRTRASVRRSFAQRPEGAAAAPRIEPDAGASGERRGQRHLGHRDEAEPHPHAVEPLWAREHRRGAERGGVIERRGEELRGDFERIVWPVVGADDRPVEQEVTAVALRGDGTDEALAAHARHGRPPRQHERRGGPGHGGEVEERAGRRGIGQGPISDALPDPRERRGCERRP